MAARRSRTAWVIAGAAVVTVVSIAVAVIALNLREDPPTEPVDPTGVPGTSSTTTQVPSTDRDGSTTTVPAEVDESEESVTVGSRERAYLLIAPRDIRPTDRLPVVTVLHGLGVDARAMSHVADWRHAVEDHRFLAVFPQGELSSWNMGPCCPPANLLGVDDRAFLDAVVAELGDRPDVDGGRMYLTGFSNGGIMVYDYACSRPGVFRAIAPMAGSNLEGCFPAEPVPLLHQHSDPDNVVPYDGRPTVGGLLSAKPFPDVPTSTATWAERAGCDPDPQSVTDADDVEHFTWRGCPPGAEVELIRIPGRGHNWPTKGDYDPLETLLEFFDLN